MVIRTFPIRVGGTSGPFENEISWEQVRARSNAPIVVPEYTSVTKKLRRVAMFNAAAVKRACEYNQPTSLAVMGMDRLDHTNTGAMEFANLSAAAREFLAQLVLPIVARGPEY
jgi:adenylosuccinate synthase